MNDLQRLTLADRIAEALVIIIVLIAAYAMVAYNDDEVKDQQSYVRQLETTLAHCLKRGDNVIKVGDQVYVCGATPLGVRHG